MCVSGWYAVIETFTAGNPSRTRSAANAGQFS